MSDYFFSLFLFLFCFVFLLDDCMFLALVLNFVTFNVLSWISPTVLYNNQKQPKPVLNMWSIEELPDKFAGCILSIGSTPSKVFSSKYWELFHYRSCLFYTFSTEKLFWKVSQNPAMEAQACEVTKNLTSLQVFSRNPYEPFQRRFFIENIRTTATR